MLNKLRDEFKLFDKYLKQVNNIRNDDLIKAYLYEIKNFNIENEFIFELDSDLVDKDVSKILYLIKSLVNLKKAEKTQIFVSVLSYISETNKWKDLNNYFSEFKLIIDKMDPEAFVKDPMEAYFTILPWLLNKKYSETKFKKYLIIRIVYILSQKDKPPPILNKYIQEGIFKNDGAFISESTYSRYIKPINNKDKTLNLLIELVEEHHNDLTIFWNYVNGYSLDNYKSTYVKDLDLSNNFAIQIPKYKGVDYKKVKLLANKKLSSKNNSKIARKVSESKIIIFLFIVKELHSTSEYSRYYISNSKISALLGDPKIVNIIRDSFEEAGYFNEKEGHLAEIKSVSYIITIDFEIDQFHSLSDPFLISKLNSKDLSVTSGLLTEEKLHFLQKVANIIEFREKNSKINFTRVFINSSYTSPLKNLLNIIVALKKSIKSNSKRFTNNEYKEAFSYIDSKTAKDLYKCLYKKLNLYLNNYDETNSYLKIPTPPQPVNEQEVKRKLQKKFTGEYIKNNPKNYEKALIKKIDKKNNKIYQNYYNELKKVCK